MDAPSKARSATEPQSDPNPVRIAPHRSPRQFLDLQRRFYQDDPHYVPPITFSEAWQVDRRKNPWFEAEVLPYLRRRVRRLLA